MYEAKHDRNERRNKQFDSIFRDLKTRISTIDRTFR